MQHADLIDLSLIAENKDDLQQLFGIVDKESREKGWN